MVPKLPTLQPELDSKMFSPRRHDRGRNESSKRLQFPERQQITARGIQSTESGVWETGPQPRPLPRPVPSCVNKPLLAVESFRP